MTVITRNARNTMPGGRGSPDAKRNTDLPFRKKDHSGRFSEIREQVMDAYRSWEVSPPTRVRIPLASPPPPDHATGRRGEQAELRELARSQTDPSPASQRRG